MSKEIKDILESVSVDKVVKVQLVEAFDTAVKNKAIELAESKEAEYVDYIDAYLTESKEALVDKMNDYLDRTINEFVEENLDTMQESLDEQKYSTILDGFGTVLETAGINFADIVQSKNKLDKEAKPEVITKDFEARIDSLVDENIELQKLANKYLVAGVKRQVSEGMTDTKREKFERLASFVKYDASNPDDFVNTLDDIAESLEDDVVTESNKRKVSKRKDINEDKKDKFDILGMSTHLY